MKRALSATLTAFLFAACTHPNRDTSVSNAPSKTSPSTNIRPVTYAPVTTWIDDFRNFRTAVLNKDEKRLKTYFNFPLQTDSSDIWLAVLNNEAYLKKVQTTHQPFTAKDFERYYAQLFSTDFLQALLKIKSAKLYATGAAETQLFRSEDTGYRLYVTYDKQEKSLTLNLAYTGIKDEKGNDMGEGEHNVNYVFTVEDNKQLHFKGLYLAG